MAGAAPITAAAVHPIRTRRRTGSISTHLVLELQDADGAIGWGEMSDLDCYRTHMPAVEAIQQTLDHLVVGTDPQLLQALHRRLRQSMPFYWRDSNAYPPFTVAGQLAAAVEMACLDLVGRALDVPVHVLFGGKVRDEIAITYPLFGLTTAGGPAATLEAVDARAAEGVRRFRYYVSDLAHDGEVLDELAGRPAVEITALDFGSRFPAKDVVRFVHRRSSDVPLAEGVSIPGDLSGLTWARSRLDCDVSEHVSSAALALQLVRADAVDVFNLSIVSGGLWLAHSLAQLAEIAGLKTVLGTTQELALGTAAGLHLAATLPSLPHANDPAGPLLYVDDIAAEPVEVRPGPVLGLPSGPGLGIEVSRDAIERLRGSLVEWDNPAHGTGYLPR